MDVEQNKIVESQSVGAGVYKSQVIKIAKDFCTIEILNYFCTVFQIMGKLILIM